MSTIINLIQNFIMETWSLTAEMAPYLLLGFVLAGLLRAFFTEDWVKRHLGQRGIKQIFKSVIIGIPLPLCSCGVIPVAAGIRKQGGQRGAVAAFTASTPQTGVDSIAATVGMIGWPFAIVRVVIAFINGVIAGLAVERWGEKDTPEEETGDRKESVGESASEAKSCCSSSDKEPVQSPYPKLKDNFIAGIKFGLITLPGDLFGALVVGLLVAGAISAFAPPDLFNGIPGGLFSLYVTMTLVSLPLYVCSTGSIPMAFSFLHAGMSPGAVLIFLIAGPATNAATVTSLWKIIGGRSTLAYILSLIVTCWVMAILIDTTGISLLVMDSMHVHEMGISLFQHAMAVVLIVILAVAKIKK